MIVIFFGNHHHIKDLLEKMQSSYGLRKLSKSCPTRWCSIKAMFERTLESKTVLNYVVHDPCFLESSAQQEACLTVKNTVISPSFVPLLTKSIAILQPIDCLIVKYQKDGVPILEVFDDLLKMRCKYNELKLRNTITANKNDYIMKLIDERSKFLLSDAHFIGYLLDPRFLGKYFEGEKKREVMKLIHNFPIADLVPSNADSTVQLNCELTNFLTTAPVEWPEDSPQIRAISSKKMMVLDFWKVFGTAWPMLMPIAINIFTLATSSAASKRNFLTFGNVHTKLRNCLRGDKVEKLVYIKTNMADCSLSKLDDFIRKERKDSGYDDELDE
jgi:hAT family C-terminal dimerisation region